MPEVAFVMSPGQDASLRELAEVVGYELELQGVPSALHLDGFPEPRPGLVYILVGLRQFLELEGEQGLADISILKRTVMLGAEPPELAARGERYRRLLRHFGVVFDTNLRSVVELHRSGIFARTLRPGYSALRDRFDAQAERPIDIAFLGDASPRRERLLSSYAPVLSRYNCLIQLADPAVPSTTPGPSFLGAERHAVLARTKLALSLHSGDGTAFDWSGALDAIHAGAVVVSEHASGIAPFDIGVHITVAGPESLAYVAEALLRDADRQQRIREAAYERLSNWIPFGLSIGVLRAALVEIVGHPVPPGAPTGRGPRAPAEPRGRWNPQAMTEPATEPATAAATGGGDADTDPLDERLAELTERLELQRRAENDLNLRVRAALSTELLTLRRQLAELQRKALGSEPLAAVLSQTPAWTAHTPATTVVLPAGTDPAALKRTAASILAGRDPDYELVIVTVDDATTAVAKAICAQHPRTPISVIGMAVDRGAGAQRNIAAEHARGAALLMTSAGDLLFPQALDHLAPALWAGAEIGLTYGIAVSQDPWGTPELTSFYGWEPPRLRLGNYIRGPYLIRTRTYRQLAGMSEDPALAGWENYDLLCRLSETAYRAELVPQIVATIGAPGNRDPESVSADPVRGPALRRRAPQLLAGLSDA